MTLTDRTTRTERTIAFALIALGVLLRLWIRYPTDFWEDEIIAATHATQPFGLMLPDIARNDYHGPVFFLQLALWALVSTSDVWLALNPLAWGLGAIWSLWFVARRLYGERAGLFAAAVFAVVPAAVFNADQLRMYAMLTTLIIWMFYLTVRLFGEDRRTPGMLAAQGVLLVAVVNSHAIGFIAVMMNGFYALHLILRKPSDRRALVPWLVLYGIAALTALPWIASGLIRDSGLGEVKSLHVFFGQPAQATIGLIAGTSPWLTALGVLCYGAAVAVGLISRKTRPLALIFLVAPLALSEVMMLANKNIYKWNYFSTLVAPFLALIPALVLADRDVRGRSREILAPLLVTALCCLSIATRLTVHVSSGFLDRANLIRANYRPGDIVFVPQQSNFWGMAWYLAGPRWGSALVVSPPPSDQWLSIYRKLGPGLVKRLHFMPDTQAVNRNGFRLLVGNNSADQARGAARIWLVTGPRADLKPGYPPAILNGLPQQWADHNHVWVTLYAPTPQHIVVPPLVAKD